MIEMTHSVFWDGVLRVLRDPIFALAFAAFLTFLGSRHIRRLVRFACLLASVVILIWLAAHNTSSAHVEIAVVTAVTRVLLAFIVLLFIIALIAMAVLIIMYFKSAPTPSSLSGGRSARRASRSLIERGFPSASASALQESSFSDAADDDITSNTVHEETDRFGDHLNRVICLLDTLSDSVDYDDNPIRIGVELMRIYFSGLSPYSAEIRKVHEECNRDIRRTANLFAETPYTVLLPLKDMSQKSWFPNSSEWATVIEGTDFRLPYLALRFICLKADWRTATMIMYKSYACLMLLAQIDEL